MKAIREMFMLQGLATEGDMTYKELHPWVKDRLGRFGESVSSGAIYTWSNQAVFFKNRPKYRFRSFACDSGDKFLTSLPNLIKPFF
jgi:hypothetical protein